MDAIYFNDFKNSYIPNILKEIYLDRVYEPYLRDKKDLTIVDIGGNIGLTSFYFKDFAKTVYYVEPSAQHRECAEAMFKFNKIENVKICPVAISNENGKTKLFHSGNTTMFSLKDVVNDTNDSEEVETKTLEQLMKDEKIESIDLLKLDTEGFESEIIASEGFKNVASKIKVIVGEWHSWTSSSQQLLTNTLKDLGFKVFWLKTDASLFVCLKDDIK